MARLCCWRFCCNPEFSLFEILWAFSIYLEALAILPQLFLLQRTGEVETLTSHYIFALGGYRAFYLLNWIYRLATEPGYSNWIVWVAGYGPSSSFSSPSPILIIFIFNYTCACSQPSFNPSVITSFPFEYDCAIRWWPSLT